MESSALRQDALSEDTPSPILKWAGGKQQLLPQLLSHVPRHFNRYIEPFVGGGALFFALRPQESIISDSNHELINLYRVIAADVESVIAELSNNSKYRNNADNYYELRSIDPQSLSEVERAARIIYLNRTCYNGLYRVNRRGEFNVPFGRYKNPRILDATGLRAASAVLQRATIVEGDYKAVLSRYARPGDFVYLDPPYLPVSQYSDFKRYTKDQFYHHDHYELAQELRRLHELGCHVLLTNSNHELVHELYGDFRREVFPTRRNISKSPSKRSGEDVLIVAAAKRPYLQSSVNDELAGQVAKYPTTRFMGSKQRILRNIWDVASWFDVQSVLDLFSGSGVVSYMFKAQGKQVYSNDYMAFATTFAQALVENNTQRLNDDDVEFLLSEPLRQDRFVQETFKGLYFSDEDNAFIDKVRVNIPRLEGNEKQALAMSSLIRACLKRRPRGIFTYTGSRYDDGRRDLRIGIERHFTRAVKLYNSAVFDNGRSNHARLGDALTAKVKADLVYIDPPYYSQLSDNEYVRRYHFVEGLARNWDGVEMQWHTKTKKFRSYPTPFSSRSGAHEALDALFQQHKDSILLVSYSSNSQPTRDEILQLMARYKSRVEVVAINHTYSFGNQGHKAGNSNNRVEEYLFVGF